MSVLILDGNPPVEVLLRRSTRARRLSLRISRLDGRATLTLPGRVPEREGMAFLREREAWLRKHLSAVEPELRVEIGSTKLIDGALMLPDDPAKAGKRVAAFMKLRARDALADASDRYAAALGKPYGRISLRDTRPPRCLSMSPPTRSRTCNIWTIPTGSGASWNVCFPTTKPAANGCATTAVGCTAFVSIDPVNYIDLAA